MRKYDAQRLSDGYERPVVAVVVVDVERIREVEIVDPVTVVSVSVAARAHAGLRFRKILYSIVIYSTETQTESILFRGFSSRF